MALSITSWNCFKVSIFKHSLRNMAPSLPTVPDTFCARYAPPSRKLTTAGWCIATSSRRIFIRADMGLEYDFVKVLDYGIVKSAEDLQGLTKLTNTNVATGTPGFMAPEMALGNDVDGRADIYALGCVAYWLLTGKLVFEEETFIATLLAH